MSGCLIANKDRELRGRLAVVRPQDSLRLSVISYTRYINYLPRDLFGRKNGNDPPMFTNSAVQDGGVVSRKAMRKHFRLRTGNRVAVYIAQHETWR